MILKEMTSEDCVDVLSRGHIAHLACAKDNRPYVVPIQYAFESPSLYGFSMPGQKIDWLRADIRNFRTTSNGITNGSTPGRCWKNAATGGSPAP
jgi:hypothetical protein